MKIGGKEEQSAVLPQVSLHLQSINHLPLSTRPPRRLELHGMIRVSPLRKCLGFLIYIPSLPFLLTQSQSSISPDLYPYS